MDASHESRALHSALVAAARARSLGYALEGGLLHFLARSLPGTKVGDLEPGPETYQRVYAELLEILERDARSIETGDYPASVLLPESPLEHLRRLPRVLLDGVRVAMRRKRGATTQFPPEAQKRLKDLPRYYRRTFHFQTDGYLSERSAELYEHQVQILFLGAADAMRRLIIPPMKRHFGKQSGDGLRFLEIGAGTGAATRFVRQAFPDARITAVDLSEPYLKHARRKLGRYDGIDFVQADGGALPFKDGQFDAVYSVFLYHELPLEARHDVLRESLRVAKSGAFQGLVDSVQAGDLEGFDDMLARFPRDFHEPFYRNYLEHPMPQLMREAGIVDVEGDRGYFSKVCWGRKADAA